MRAIRKMQRVVIALFILVLLAFCGDASIAASPWIPRPR